MRLYGWNVTRGRRGVVAAGVDHDGAPAEISGIARLEPRGRAVVATDSKGEEHELVVGGQSN
jgi:hypothetical protein